MTDETKVEPTPTAADTQAGALLAPSADAGKPAGLSETELARLTDEVIGALKTVYDPEMPADIYEIGLVYKIDIADDRAVTVDMTLTTLVPTYCLSVVAMQAALSTLSGQRLQSSSASRRAAAQAGFLLLIQCGERPDL